MIREILDWLQLASQQGVPLEQFSSPGLALLAVFGLGLLFVAVPAGGSELFALAAGSVTPRGMAVPCSCCSPLGTSSASSSGSGLAGSVRGHQSEGAGLDRADTSVHGTASATRRGDAADISPGECRPFHLLAVAAGVVRVPLGMNFWTALLGRLVRFGVVAGVRGVVRWIS